ncbi:MAG: YbjN domain-containing protein [Janthinobacterium lividum]
MSKSMTHKESAIFSNPIDFIEETISEEDWAYHRIGPKEIAFEIPGRWGDYRLQFVWQDDMKILQLFAILDMQATDKNLPSLYELLSIINARLPLGHFEISHDDGMPTYRNSLLHLNARNLTTEYLEDIVDIAVIECERFYPAFQFVIWGGKSAKEAADVALLETQGEA